MKIYLYPPPNQFSRFFDEYYSELIKTKTNENIEVKLLEPRGKICKKIFYYIMNNLSHKFPKLPVIIINFLLRKEKDSIIHFTTQLSVQPNIKNGFIFTYHDIFHMQPQYTGSFYSKEDIDRIDLAYEKAICIITDSYVSKKSLEMYYPKMQKNIFVVYLGITKGKIIDPKQRDKNHLLFIGSTHPRKNLLVFLEAISLLHNPDIHISIVCNISGSKYKDAFYTIIKKLNLKNITIYERIPVKELNDLYDSAGILVFPTFAEGFGLPPVEAQSHGLPVIASDIPICHEILGDSCLYFNPLSAEDFANKINQLINLYGTNHISKYISEGYNNITKYNMEKIIKEQLAIYNTVSNNVV